jgi:hypothetical protein
VPALHASAAIGTPAVHGVPGKIVEACASATVFSAGSSRFDSTSVRQSNDCSTDRCVIPYCSITSSTLRVNVSGSIVSSTVGSIFVSMSNLTW